MKLMKFLDHNTKLMMNGMLKLTNSRINIRIKLKLRREESEIKESIKQEVMFQQPEMLRDGSHKLITLQDLAFKYHQKIPSTQQVMMKTLLPSLLH